MKVAGGLEKRRGDDAEDERFVGSCLCPHPLCSVAVKNSVVVKRASPRADGSGSYSRSTAFRACGFGQVA